MSERASGEADDSTLSNTKKERFDCKQCGSTFIDYPSNDPKFCSRDCYGDWRDGRYTGSDHWQHKEKVELTCGECGDSYKVQPSESDRSKYCSRECQMSALPTRNTGEDNPHYKERVKLECEHCGADYEKVPSVAEYSRFCSMDCKTSYFGEMWTGEGSPRYDADNHVEHECVNCGCSFNVYKKSLERNDRVDGKYCSSECMDQWRSENWVGENNPLYVDSSVECDHCGDTFQKKPAKIEANDLHFCCRSCHGKWMSENNVGENHPRWKENAVGSIYYGPNWGRQKRKARISDQGRCQICGDTPIDTGQQAHVHHKKKIRWFKDNYDEPEWYEKGNDLDNLICLCGSCHKSFENLSPLVPDTRP